MWQGRRACHCVKAGPGTGTIHPDCVVLHRTYENHVGVGYTNGWPVGWMADQVASASDLGGAALLVLTSIVLAMF